VRVAHAVVGGAAGVVWLVLPGMTTGTDAPVAITRSTSVVAAPPQDPTDTADLVLPLLAVGAAGALAGYGYVRRVRRAQGRTTPGGTGGVPPPAGSGPPSAELEARAAAALVRADDRIRSARTELDFARARSGEEAVAPFARALADAETEAAAAFRMRQRYDEGIPEEPAARRHALAGIIGRCEEAGRRLDAVAGDFGRLRGLEEGVGEALAVAEGRFRELTGRTAAAQSLLAGLRARYAATASSAVAGNVEQAKDRLVFATDRLNRARQADDAGRLGAAARQLLAAEGAIAQAAVLVGGVERLAAELREAEAMIPAVLTGAEAELAPARGPAGSEGEAFSRLLHADAVLASVRHELAGGRPLDPVGVLRRIVRATVPPASARTGVLATAAHLVARGATATTADFVTTHRAAVDAPARTRLAEARRLLAEDDAPRADALALEAQELAEQDVRVRGNPLTTTGSGAPGTGPTAGTAGAVLGGLLPPDAPDDGPPPGFAAPPPPPTDPG
jgi:hypothetical protein